MKFATLVAAAAAHVPYEPIELASPIGSGICSAFAGYDFYNLKDFDALNRNKDKHTPATITNAGSSFQFKTCQLQWKNDNSACKTDGTAYYIDKNGNCASFDNADWDPIMDGEKSNGFTLTWNTKQLESCPNGFNVVMTATCDNTNEGGNYHWVSDTNC